MITGDDPTLTLIVWIPTALLILMGELGNRSILAGLPRIWRLASYILIGDCLAMIITLMAVIIAATVKASFPWL